MCDKAQQKKFYDLRLIFALLYLPDSLKEPADMTYIRQSLVVDPERNADAVTSDRTGTTQTSFEKSQHTSDLSFQSWVQSSSFQLSL